MTRRGLDMSGKRFQTVQNTGQTLSTMQRLIGPIDHTVKLLLLCHSTFPNINRRLNKQKIDGNRRLQILSARNRIRQLGKQFAICEPGSYMTRGVIHDVSDDLCPWFTVCHVVCRNVTQTACLKFVVE
jgi:hypothetical protein